MEKEMKQEIRKIMFSSKKHNWITPKDTFNDLDKEFHFNVDVCGDFENKLHPQLATWAYTFGLQVSWNNMTCWMNPPYGREITKWITKAYVECKKNNALVVALLPARTDTNWFWDFCIDQEIRLIKGRLKFSNHKNPAPFPSMVVIFRP